jgi:vancomycin resistance protein VanJ
MFLMPKFLFMATPGAPLFRNRQGRGTIDLLQILCLWFWTCLWLFALTMSVCLILGWTSGDRLLLVRLTRYLLPWVLLSLLAGLIPAVLFRRVWLALALTGPALVIAFSYLPVFLPNHAPPPGDRVLLKVMSFNVWSENQSLLQVAQLIREKAPDILMLQEITSGQIRELTLALEKSPDGTRAGWNVAYAPQVLQAVVSRHPVTPLRSSLKIAKVQAVRVATPAGEVTVFNVHPRRGNWKGRHRQLATLLQEDVLTAPGPVILGGDFNTTDKSQTYRMLSRHLHNAHWEAGRGFGFTYPAYQHAWNEFLPAWPLVRIDHIFYSQDFFAVTAETLKEPCGSDHLPVMASLALKEKPKR